MYYFLGYIVDQIDDRKFRARLCGTDKVVECFVSHQLFRNNTPVLMGDLIKLEYNATLRRIKRRLYYIIEVI